MAFIATVVNMPQMRRSNWSPRNPKVGAPPIIEPPGRPPIRPRTTGGFNHNFVHNMPTGPRGKARKGILYRNADSRTIARAVRATRYTRNAPAQRGVPAQNLAVFRGDRRQGRRVPVQPRGTRLIAPGAVVASVLS